nr:uncharacterized protein LOC127346537 [Lolium perenne]
MALPRSPATSAKRGSSSRAPPNPSPAPLAADGASKLLLRAAHDGDLRLLKGMHAGLHLDSGRVRGRPREVVEAAEKEAGFRALFMAARYGRLPVCRYLVEELGVDVALSTPKYNKMIPGIGTPLFVAINASSVKCVQLLVEAGADVNDGIVTPLGAAVLNGETACIKCLLEAGADPNVPVSQPARLPIEIAALNGTREDVEILFPVTSCIPTVNDWSIDGIIQHVKSEFIEEVDLNVSKIRELRSLAANSMKKNDYYTAAMLYSLAMGCDPHDATLLSNRSLCCLRMGDGHAALQDALACREMRPNWPKGCYRQGAALMLLKDYGSACDAFLDAVKLDPPNPDIEAALREALSSLKISHYMTKSFY